MCKKICPKCQKTKAFSEFFKSKTYKDGCRTYCKKCEQLSIMKYRKKNKKVLKEYNKRYKEFNKEHAKKLAKEYKQKNKKRIKEYNSQYMKKYLKKNRKRLNAIKMKYKAAKRNAAPKWLTDEQIKQMEQIYANCPKKYHVDHIVPLQGKNVSGLHVPWNLQYLPAHENIAKGNKLK